MQVSGEAVQALSGAASALKEAARQAVTLSDDAFAALDGVAGAAFKSVGGLAGDLIAARRARKEQFKAREVIIL